jgi:hypothetical protein
VLDCAPMLTHLYENFVFFNLCLPAQILKCQCKFLFGFKTQHMSTYLYLVGLVFGSLDKSGILHFNVEELLINFSILDFNIETLRDTQDRRLSNLNCITDRQFPLDGSLCFQLPCEGLSVLPLL